MKCHHSSWEVRKVSRERIKTSLDGYDGPIFPDIVDELNTNYDEVGSNRDILSRIGVAIKTFETNNCNTTNDHYPWFRSLHFKIGKGSIAILFPWRQDWENKDGVQLDRSIALYTKGKVAPADIQEIMENLVSEFKRR